MYYSYDSSFMYSCFGLEVSLRIFFSQAQYFYLPTGGVTRYKRGCKGFKAYEDAKEICDSKGGYFECCFTCNKDKCNWQGTNEGLLD